MKYILSLFFLLFAAIAAAQTPTLFDTWSPELAGTEFHVKITAHEVILIESGKGLPVSFPEFMTAPAPQDAPAIPAPPIDVAMDNAIGKADTVQVLKIIYDSAKADGRIFLQISHVDGFILPLRFHLKDNGETEIGLACDVSMLIAKKSLKQLEKATRKTAKRRQSGSADLSIVNVFSNFSFTFYNATRTAEFAQMKDPAKMPKEELIGIIHSFGDRMAAALQSTPQPDTSNNPFAGIFFAVPIVENVTHIARDLFMAHGYNPLAIASCIEKFKDDSDVNDAGKLMGEKIEESVPALRAAKHDREVAREESLNTQTAELDATFRKRIDVVLNLTDQIKATEGTDQKILEEIIHARSLAAAQTLTPEIVKDSLAFEQFQNIQNNFTTAITNLFAAIEKSNLNAKENLSTALSLVEAQQNRITVECMRWNGEAAAHAGTSELRKFTLQSEKAVEYKPDAH